MPGAAVEARAVLSGKPGKVRRNGCAPVMVVVVYIRVGLDIDGVFEQGGQLGGGPAAALGGFFVLRRQDFQQLAQGDALLGVEPEDGFDPLRLGGDGAQGSGFDIVDDRWDQLKAIGPAAPHVEPHFAAVGVGLGDPADDGRALELGKHHQQLYQHFSIG